MTDFWQYLTCLLL